MASLVSLTSRAPSKFAEELSLAGHRAHEALAVSEALYLCEQGPVDVIVIAPNVEDPDLIEAQLHHVTIRMNPDGTAKDLVWELSQVFRRQASRSNSCQCAIVSYVNRDEILSKLESQRDRVNQAIVALTGDRRRGRKQHRMSAEARRRIGEAQKKRWAAQKKK